MTKPTINLNGSSAAELAKQNREAYIAVQAAVNALCAITPHGRDYQLAPETYQAARDEHNARVKALQGVADELYQLAMFCHDAQMDRERRRDMIASARSNGYIG